MSGRMKTGGGLAVLIIVLTLVAPRDSVVGHIRWSVSEAMFGQGDTR